MTAKDHDGAGDGRKERTLRRDDFPVLRTISTRWEDEDVYGHVNNVTYYSYFDTAVNRYLIEAGVLDIHAKLEQWFQVIRD